MAVKVRKAMAPVLRQEEAKQSEAAKAPISRLPLEKADAKAEASPQERELPAGNVAQKRQIKFLRHERDIREIKVGLNQMSLEIRDVTAGIAESFNQMERQMAGVLQAKYVFGTEETRKRIDTIAAELKTGRADLKITAAADLYILPVMKDDAALGKYIRRGMDERAAQLKPLLSANVKMRGAFITIVSDERVLDSLAQLAFVKSFASGEKGSEHFRELFRQVRSEPELSYAAAKELVETLPEGNEEKWARVLRASIGDMSEVLGTQVTRVKALAAELAAKDAQLVRFEARAKAVGLAYSPPDEYSDMETELGKHEPRLAELNEKLRVLITEVVRKSHIAKVDVSLVKDKGKTGELLEFWTAFPEYPTSHWRCAVLCEQLGKFKEAIAESERHLELFELTPAMLDLQIRCYEALGYKEKANAVRGTKYAKSAMQSAYDVARMLEGQG